MGHSSRSRSASLSYLTFLAAALCASTLSAVTWPSGACAGTLQACIDAAAAGEVIEIATNGPINESPQVNDKSLTLRPAAGFAPVFSSPNSIFVFGGDVAATNVVEGMTIANGRLVAVQGGEGAFDVTFRANVILDTYSYGAAVEIRSGNTQPPYGPVTFDVSDNRITVDGFSAGDQIGAISVGSFESDGRGRIAGNVIVQTGESTQNAVIGAYSGAHALTVDILANDIGGQGFNNGISLFQFAPGGSITARVVNNLVRGGQIDVAGQPGGIGLNVSQGDGVFTVVNNTIANGDRGILVGGRADLGATLTGVLANNIVAGHASDGISIEDDFAATFVNHHNLVFGNGGEYFTPGPGTLHRRSAVRGRQRLPPAVEQPGAAGRRRRGGPRRHHRRPRRRPPHPGSRGRSGRLRGRGLRRRGPGARPARPGATRGRDRRRGARDEPPPALKPATLAGGPAV